MRETWYVLEDGRAVDPAECVCDDKGALRHKDGEAIAMRGDAHSSRSVDPDEQRGAAATKPAQSKRDLKPEDKKQGYKTREAKAD